jgi:hypothetical protein
MRHLHFIAACALPVLLLGGCPAPASEGDRKPEDRLVVYSRYSRGSGKMILHNGKFREEEYNGRWEWMYSNQPGSAGSYLLYDGVMHRMLSGAEKARMDTMGRVEVRRGRLYFDGRKIRINAKRVRNVYAAYHWNGGVVLAANTSNGETIFHALLAYTYFNEIGFLDLKSGRCRLTPVFPTEIFPVTPDFMEPVRIDTNPGGIALDVAMPPEKLFLGEEIDLAVSLTNRSGGVVQAPDSLAGGLKMMSAKIVRDPSSGEDAFGIDLWKYLGDLADPGAPSSPLGPNERRASPVRLNVRKALSLNNGDIAHNNRVVASRLGSLGVVFQWDGFLDPSDRRRMSSITCKGRMEVVEPTIDTSDARLRLDVAVPESVPTLEDTGDRKGGIEVTVGLTNVSDRAVLVPDNPGDGLGVVSLNDRQPVFRSYQEKYPVLLDPRRGRCSPLEPGERREGKATFSGFLLSSPSSRIEIYWDGFLDPDDRGHVTRFSLGKPIWVKVTK